MLVIPVECATTRNNVFPIFYFVFLNSQLANRESRSNGFSSICLLMEQRSKCSTTETLRPLDHEIQTVYLLSMQNYIDADASAVAREHMSWNNVNLGPLSRQVVGCNRTSLLGIHLSACWGHFRPAARSIPQVNRFCWKHRINSASASAFGLARLCWL